MHKPYDRQAVLNDIKDFGASNDGQKVSTTMGDKLVRSVEVSSQYQLLDFKAYISRILAQVEQHIVPAKYYIELRQGIQEINLLSKPFEVCGEQYCKGFYILNSTDKTRALQFMAGLYRVASDTEVVITFNETLADVFAGSLGDAATYSKVVHKGYNFQSKIDQMSSFITRLERLIEAQIMVLEELNNQKVSAKALLREMLYENAEIEDGVTTKLASASKVRAATFSRQLMRGKDRIVLTEDVESADDFYKLATPLDFVRTAKTDIMLNCYQALQCYLNAYTTRDTSVLRRECARFTTYLDIVGTEEINPALYDESEVGELVEA